MNSGVIARLVMAVTQSSLIVVLPILQALSPELLAAMRWPQWAFIIGTTIVAGLNGARQFLDQSISRSKNEG